MQLTMEATHFLESQGHTSLAVKVWFTTEATHKLNSQQWVSSTESKPSPPNKPPTCWIDSDRHSQQPPMQQGRIHSLPGEKRTGYHQQDPNPAHNGSHSQTGQQRTGVMSKVQMQVTREATHMLERQQVTSSRGSKYCPLWKPLTC